MKSFAFARSMRSFAATFTVVALLFSQLAAAAHPCPQLAAAIEAADSREADEDAEAKAPRACCPHDADETSGTASALCVSHCQQGQQNVVTASAADLSFFPAFTIRLSARDDFLERTAHESTGESVTSGASPPFATRKAILRI
jgi:hypothetical protein